MKLSLDTLLDQEFEGRHRAERVLKSEVVYVWYLIGWITKTFDYINCINLTLPLVVYEGTWTQSPPLVAMHILDRSCVIVGIFLKLHGTFPNSTTDLLRWLTQCLCVEFAIKDLAPLHYFLGIEVVRRAEGFFLHK